MTQPEMRSPADTQMDVAADLLVPRRHPVETHPHSMVYLGVELPKGAGGRLVPELSRFAKNVITTDDLQLMQQIAVAWDLNQAILLEGGSGLGKTETIERMCAQLNRECYYANCHDFDAETIIGSKTIKDGTQTGFGWVDGIVLQAIRKGGILFLDEYNFMKGDTRGRLHEILDAFLRGKTKIALIENNGETVEVHPDFRLVAAQNQPGGEYGDRETLDPAQLTRFVYIKLASDIPRDLRLARAMGAIGRGGHPDVDDQLYLNGRHALDREALNKLEGLDVLVGKFVEFTEDIEREVKERTLAADQPQPIYFSFQRDFNRVLGFVARYYEGDLNLTFQRALHYYYENRFESPIDREKVREHIQQVNYVSRSGSPRIALSNTTNGAARTRDIDPAFRDRGMRFIEEQIKAGASLSSLNAGLSGIMTPAAATLRHADRTRADGKILSLGITGDDSKDAWETRNGLMSTDLHLDLVAVSLGGLNSAAAWKMRAELEEKGISLASLVRSVTAVDAERAWSLRQRLLSENPTKEGHNIVLDSLAGLESDRAVRLREKIAQGEVSYVPYFRSLTGIATPESMRVRVNNLGRRPDNLHLKVGVALSLAGIDTPESWALREKLAEFGTPARYLIQSVAGLSSARAWSLRERLIACDGDAGDRACACLSIFGDDVVAAVRAGVGL